MTGVANQNSHSAQSSHKTAGGAAKADSQATSNSNSGAQNAADKGQTAQQQEKVLITGDDILIEYVDRLMN